jgi:hypothetical protein
MSAHPFYLSFRAKRGICFSTRAAIKSRFLASLGMTKGDDCRILKLKLGSAAGASVR